jgi:hypothetical protein
VGCRDRGALQSLSITASGFFAWLYCISLENIRFALVEARYVMIFAETTDSCAMAASHEVHVL